MTQVDALLAALPLPVLRIDADERISHANATAETMFGPGRVGLHYITALRQPVLLDAIEESLADGTARTSRFTGDARPRPETWQVSVTPIAAPIGGLLLVFDDITDVESAGQMRRDFVANVSHELRTPLTALLGFIETLRGAAKDDPGARDRFLTIMEHEAGRMAALVDDLLSLSRVEEEERQRPMEPVRLERVIEAVAHAQDPAAREASVVLDITCPDGLPPVPGDARQLEQVMTNLVANAVKYGGSGGRVEVIVEGPERLPALRCDGVRVLVRDFGEGVAPHHLARLTERFYRVDTHRSREVGGTGLGLAIVKHIVNRHRGRLRIDSEHGEGTQVSVLLPLD